MNFKEFLDERFGGVLDSGGHSPVDGMASVNEAYSQYIGEEWTDNAEILGCFDLQELNDAPWSSGEVRAKHMAPVVDAVQDGKILSSQERTNVFRHELAIRIVRNVTAEWGPGLPPALRAYLRGAKNLDEVKTWINENIQDGRIPEPIGQSIWMVATNKSTSSTGDLCAHIADEYCKKAGGDPAHADAVLKVACRCFIGAAEAAKRERTE